MHEKAASSSLVSGFLMHFFPSDGHPMLPRRSFPVKKISRRAAETHPSLTPGNTMSCGQNVSPHPPDIIKMEEPNMAFDIAKDHLNHFNLAGRIQVFDVSSATVDLAAQAVGCEPAHIAKTLSFMVDGAPVLVVAAGDAKVDNRRYKDEFGTKAKMLTPQEAEDLVGHAVGGVCPFGVKPGVRVFLDQSLKRFEEVYPACGSANSAVRLSIPELELSSGCEKWVDVCKGWREQ